MRRPLVALLLMGGLTLVGGLLGRYFAHSEVPADADGVPAPQPVQATVQLPIAQVALFGSGVGYFQREGQVEGNARIDLSFPVQDVNDLLKSMVVQDLGGGHVSAVSCDGQAPIDKTLRSFAIDLTSNPSFAEILHQARGEKVEITLQQGANAQPGMLTGILVGVEQPSLEGGRRWGSKPVVACSKQSAEEGAIEHLLTLSVNLWCAEGMRSIKLSDVQRVRFLNPMMDSEMKKALEVLALSHDTQKKAVSVNFNGEGKRAVKVGYVVENPIWKTSYRLVLDEKGKPFLQGWAVVENTQDEDWTNVRMSLISGRPISFRMDLYQPLSVPRPVVEPELFASLRPPTYNGNLQNQSENMAVGVAVPATNLDAPAPAPCAVAPGWAPAAPPPPTICKGPNQGFARHPEGRAIDPRESVQSAAVAGQLGNFFEYRIAHPVTLPRQKSALLPIVNEEVEGTKVSIYNESTHAKFPLLGLKFKNSTKLHLMQGPITVFDNNSYAGDARILDLEPKEERLIAYAIDLGTEVEPASAVGAVRITKLKINKGVIQGTYLHRQSKTYTIKNRSEIDRVVLVEHPYRPEFKLVEPTKASERSRDVYRFEVKVPAGKAVKHDVVEERTECQSLQISTSPEPTLRAYSNEPVAGEHFKAAVAQAVALQQKAADARAATARQQQRLVDINGDQARLREDLKTVPQDSAAHKRYVKKFDDQETEIEQIQAAIKKLQRQEERLRKDFEDYLADLNVE